MADVVPPSTTLDFLPIWVRNCSKWAQKETCAYSTNHCTIFATDYRSHCHFMKAEEPGVTYSLHCLLLWQEQLPGCLARSTSNLWAQVAHLFCHCHNNWMKLGMDGFWVVTHQPHQQLQALHCYFPAKQHLYTSLVCKTGHNFIWGFRQVCSWELRPYKWCCIDGKSDPDILRQPTVPIFKDRNVQENISTFGDEDNTLPPAESDYPQMQHHAQAELFHTLDQRLPNFLGSSCP